MPDTRQGSPLSWILGGFILLALLGVREFWLVDEITDSPTAESSTNIDPTATQPASSESPARVTYVADGDSLVVIRGEETFRVRLSGVDAPEKGQIMADESKSFTERLCLERDVTLKKHGTDKYDRVLAEVFVNGVCVNRELVRAGLAWAYDDQDVTLLRLEQEARAARLGIWMQSNPIRPSDWRRQQSKQATGQGGGSEG